MHSIVKITKRDDGQIVELRDQKWCLVADASGSPCTLCSQEVFGYGEGNAEYEEKTVKKGGITCECCLEMIKVLKKIKL